MNINDPVNTPNGPALAQHVWYNMDDPDGEYIMVRHPKPKKGEPDVIDLTLCAHVFSATGRNGWLVAYRMEEVKP